MTILLCTLSFLFSHSSGAIASEESDFNGDGQITLDDFFLLADAWESSEENDDFDKNGGVDWDDLSTFITNYQKTTGSPIHHSNSGYIAYTVSRNRKSSLQFIKPDGSYKTGLLGLLPNSPSQNVGQFCISLDGSLLSLTLAGIPKLYWIKPLERPSNWSFIWLEEDHDINRLSCSPDGHKILIGYDIDDDRISYSTDYFIGLLDIRDPANIRMPEVYGLNASWLPNSSSIVYASGDGVDVRERNLDTKDDIVLVEGPFLDFPIVNENRNLVVFTSNKDWDSNDRYAYLKEVDIYARDLDSSSAAIQLVNGNLDEEEDLSFSPNDSLIVFERRGNLYITDFSGNETPLVVDDSEVAYQPIWIHSDLHPIGTNTAVAAIPESEVELIKNRLLQLGYRFTSAQYLTAVIEDDTLAVGLFIDGGISVNYQYSDKWGSTGKHALYIATENRQTEMIRYLLARGADPSIGYGDGYITPLMNAAARGDNDIISLFIQYGVRIDYTNIDDTTALFYAIGGKHIETVDLLIQSGANVHHIGFGSTTLMSAASSGSIEIASLLLEKGVSIDAKHLYYEYTALYSAVDARTIPKEDKIEMVRLLLDNGADPNTSDDKGFTPLISASIDGEIEVMRLLIQSGADVNAASSRGRTPISSAIQFGHFDAAQLLLNAGAECPCKPGIEQLCSCETGG